MVNFDTLSSIFLERYQQTPFCYFAPGRINLIGDHTDYNDGFVLPAAIDKGIYIALQKNTGSRIRLYAVNYQEEVIVDLNELKPQSKLWANYLIGVVNEMQEAGYAVGGFDCVFAGDVPIGSGLSSSAALECGIAFGLNAVFDFHIPKITLIKMAQSAEHRFAGVQCGIMDQFASMMGKEDHALRLDCRSLEYAYFPLDFKNYQIVLCNTMVKHSLADSGYNERRSQCETGVAIVKKYHPEVRSLRDVTQEMLSKAKEELGPLIYDRCSFVLEENDRVLNSTDYLLKDDLINFGKLMFASHHGLSKKYEVSCPELDFLVELASTTEGVLGARMMGGGFGGCTINLVARDRKKEIINRFQSAYENEFGITPDCFEVEIRNGTHAYKTHKS
ncbi:galactokinase [Flavobacteriaceae bacterium M23B6Z8]